MSLSAFISFVHLQFKIFTPPLGDKMFLITFGNFPFSRAKEIRSMLCFCQIFYSLDEFSHLTLPFPWSKKIHRAMKILKRALYVCLCSMAHITETYSIYSFLFFLTNFIGVSRILHHIACFYLSVRDLSSTDIKCHFHECFQFIDEAIQKGGGILVHCYAGVSRR